MTKKLYDEDAYMTEFDADVVSVEEKNGKFEVVLDATAFFPEGGGQAADSGYLSDIPVLDVQEKGGVVCHIMPEAPRETRVHGVIDWDVRYRRMQNHTGEHLVSGIVHQLFDYNNVGFHMGEDFMTVDFDGPLTAEQIAEVECEANAAVYANADVLVEYVDNPDFEYRSKLALSKNVRIVMIRGYDVCACCAPHVKKTGEVGILKILDAAPHKGGTRITMLCGRDAYEDYCALHENTRALMKTLSAPRDGVVGGVEKLMEDLALAKAEISALKSRLAKANFKSETIGTWTVGFLGEAGFDALREIINGMEENTALFSESGEYMIRGEGAGELTKKINAAFSGKGGGKPNFTQGKCTAKEETVRAFFEEMKA